MKLYRGENFSKGNPTRMQSIKSFARQGFPADFINGGDPYTIAKMGMFDASVVHVANNFERGAGRCNKKHFISFSANQAQAELYATHSWNGTAFVRNSYDLLPDYYTENIDPERDIWDSTLHLLIELDISAKTPVQEGYDYGFILKYNGGHNKLFLLDVVKYLELQLQRIGTPSAKLQAEFPAVIPQIQVAIQNAKKDSEWLAISLDPLGDGTFSAFINNSPELLFNHYVDPDWYAL